MWFVLYLYIPILFDRVSIGNQRQNIARKKNTTEFLELTKQKNKYFNNNNNNNINNKMQAHKFTQEKYPANIIVIVEFSFDRSSYQF